MSKSHEVIKATNPLFDGDVVWPEMTLEPGFRDARKHTTDEYEPVVDRTAQAVQLHRDSLMGDDYEPAVDRVALINQLRCDILATMGLDKETIEVLKNAER